ncbi:UDP-N-acetylglucosamine-peptide N-acetylglucosaminyltransferase [Acrasis kona]|uniref:UDP-N-acetylglucosamine-peptide N-acetylglucosaminyltransferase n=1 Tax=Acrasis kona TaxID=1008807 RepID=A0AAW2Z0F6_9EUKA
MQHSYGTTRECGKLLDAADKARFRRDMNLSSAYFEQCIEKYPFCCEVYFRKSLLYYETDNKILKLRCVRQAKMCQPNEYFQAICDGYEEEIMGRLESAIEHFEKATRLTNSNFYHNNRYEAFFKLAFINMNMKRYEQAITTYLLAIEENETSAQLRPHISALCYNNIGCCYQELDNLGTAHEYYQRAIALYQSYILPRRNVVDIYNQLGRYDAVIKESKKILKDVDDNYTTKLTLMDIVDANLHLNKFKSTKKICERLKREFPSEYYAYLVESDIEQDVYKRIQIIDEGLSKVREHQGISELLLTRSDLFEATGQTEKANQDLILAQAIESGMLGRCD